MYPLEHHTLAAIKCGSVQYEILRYTSTGDTCKKESCLQNSMLYYKFIYNTSGKLLEALVIVFVYSGKVILSELNEQFKAARSKGDSIQGFIAFLPRYPIWKSPDGGKRSGKALISVIRSSLGDLHFFRHTVPHSSHKIPQQATLYN